MNERGLNERGLFRTTSGRAVFVIELQMARTFRGLLAGSPERASELRRKKGFDAIRRELREEFGVERAAFVLDDGRPALPGYRWLAYFEAEPVHTTDIEWRSRLALCWFTEAIPADLEAVITGVVGQLAWEEAAEDFDASW